MTEKEAIEIIIYASAFNRDNSPLTIALEKAITALEENQQYHEIGTVEQCRGAMEKLKAYEDTKLTPEQILEIDRMYRELCEQLDKLQAEQQSHEDEIR